MHAALQALRETLIELADTSDITEFTFRNEWFKRLSYSNEIIASGWYSPPPDGFSVLTDAPYRANRLNYTSLRSPENWPSNKIIDWSSSVLMAYCCPIHRSTGLAGDVAVTIYFGKDKKIIEYFNKARSVFEELLYSISINDTSAQIVERGDRLFRKNRLKSYVSSITDKSSYNIGHTIPKLDPKFLGESLSEIQREECRLQRRFLNYVDDWEIAQEKHFSIEPQLRSEDDESLPKLTFHKVVHVRAQKVCIPADVEDIYLGGGL